MLLKRGLGTVRSRRRSAETYRGKQGVLNDQSGELRSYRTKINGVVEKASKSASCDARREFALEVVHRREAAAMNLSKLSESCIPEAYASP